MKDHYTKEPKDFGYITFSKQSVAQDLIKFGSVGYDPLNQGYTTRKIKIFDYLRRGLRANINPTAPDMPTRSPADFSNSGLVASRKQETNNCPDQQVGSHSDQSDGGSHQEHRYSSAYREFVSQLETTSDFSRNHVRWNIQFNKSFLNSDRAVGPLVDQLKKRNSASYVRLQ